MWFRVGIVAIVASFAAWVVIALAPLVGPVVGLSLGEAGGAIGVLLVIAEVLFWAGLALAGKDTWRTVKVYGWRRAPGELTKLLVHGRPEQASERPGDQPAEAAARVAELDVAPIQAGITRSLGVSHSPAAGVAPEP